MKSALVLLAAFSLAAAANAQVLWDNGPLATGTTTTGGTVAPTGTQWSEMQKVGTVSNGLVSLGVNYTLAAPNRLVDDFTVTGAGWNISSFIVFGAQTGSGTTSTLTSGVVRIWDAKPTQPGANVIFGDLTTNRLTSSTFSNIYRTSRGTGSTSRPEMAATLSMPIFLAPGTYWMEYGLAGSLAGSVQSPLVTIVDSLGAPGANSLFFGNTGYVSVMDTNSSVPQDVPFQVIGTPAPEPCSMIAVGLGAVAMIRRRKRA